MGDAEVSDVGEREQAGSRSHRLPKPEGPRRDYHNITAQDNARMQLGDNTYIEHQNIYESRIPTAEEKRQQQQQAFLDRLSFASMDSRLATIRAAHAKSCEWLLTQAGYLRWRDPTLRTSHSGFLWIKGKPGSGKSTLMKYALRHMQKRHRPHTTVLSFFFNARGDHLEKSTAGMYRSLLHQLFTKLPHRIPTPLPKVALGSKQQNSLLPIFQDMLQNAILGLTRKEKLICYIDALDECAEDDIREAIRYFEDLGTLASTQNVQFSVCFASRHYPQISIRRHETINIDLQKEHYEDISRYVSDQLCAAESLREELGRKISDRSAGVFLWAALVVQIVNVELDHGATLSQALTALGAVPSGVAELLKRIIRGASAALLPTLQWVLFSMRPLADWELYLATMTSLGGLGATLANFAETTTEQMRAFILASSKGLVEFTKEDKPKAQFIHESVKEHLLAGGLEALDPTLDGSCQSKSHDRLWRWCLSYIDDHRAQSATRRALFVYALDRVFDHMEIAYEGGATDLTDVDAASWKSWISVASARNRDTKWSNVSPLYILLSHDCTGLVEAMLRRQLSLLNFKVRNKRQTTSTASGTPSLAIPRININTLHGKREWNTLELAVRKGNTKIMQLLLDCGADPNTGVKSKTPLVLAVEQGDKQAVQLLLDCSASPNASTRRSGTPLHAALRTSSPKIAKLLLHHGAYANGDNKNYGSPLTSVVGHGLHTLSQILLNHGADANGQTNHRPLHAAVSRLETSLVRKLLSAGADVTAKDRSGRTALHIIVKAPAHAFRSRLRNQSRSRLFCVQEARRTRVRIATMLLDAGADMNAFDHKSHTALAVAKRSKRPYLVQLFVDRNTHLDMIVDGRLASEQVFAKSECEWLSDDEQDPDASASDTGAVFGD